MDTGAPVASPQAAAITEFKILAPETLTTGLVATKAGIGAATAYRPITGQPRSASVEKAVNPM